MRKKFFAVPVAVVAAVLWPTQAQATQYPTTVFTGPYKITVSNVRFGFNGLWDCGFFGGSNCRTAQINGYISLFASDNQLGTNANTIHIAGGNAPEGGWNVSDGTTYYPAGAPFYASTSNEMAVTANLNNRIAVKENFWDQDWFNDDDICTMSQFDSFSFNTYSVLSAPNHKVDKVFSTDPTVYGEGSCWVAFTVTAS